MTTPTKGRGSYAWFIPILLGLGIAASSVFDNDNDEPQTVTIRGVTYENVIPDTIETCSDRGLPNTDTTCVTALDTMDRDAGDFSVGRFLLGAALLVVGLLGLTGYLGKLMNRDERSTFAMLPFLQDDGGLIPMLSDRHAAYLLIVLVIGAVVWLAVKRPWRSP